MDEATSNKNAFQRNATGCAAKIGVFQPNGPGVPSRDVVFHGVTSPSRLREPVMIVPDSASDSPFCMSYPLFPVFC